MVTTRMLHCLASQLQQRVYVEIRTRGHGCSSKLCELRRVNRGAHLLSSSSLTTLKFHPGEENGRRLAVIGQEIGRASHRKSSSTATVSEDSVMAPATEMVHHPILMPGVFRFDATEAARRDAHPSLSFADPGQRDAILSDVKGAPLAKDLSAMQCLVEGEQQTITIELPPGTSFYGTGEVSGPLERSGRRVVTWNTDAWGYGRATSALYQSHPWVLAVLPDGTSLGILADTTRRCEVDLRQEHTVKMTAPSPFPLITFGPFPSPKDVMAALSTAIGRVDFPPKWALGYHQCRFSYDTHHRVVQVARTFREKRIPCDVIWMDIDYMDGFRCFTFDPKSFPDPPRLAADLHALGMKAVWMLDPGIKQESGYSAYDSGAKEDVWVQEENGQPFIGNVWPGPCCFPDYTAEHVRQWWAGLVADFVKNGVDGIWNDMNEPSVFNTVSKTMPDGNLHRGDPGMGGKQTHLHYHNVYGMLMARATWEGMKAARPDKRPFVLTRAAYIGSQRYAATWTGDNLATWEHLHFSISMAINLSLSGQPFCGPDIGGFAGDSNPRLFARWMGIGALLPFSRGHSETGTRDHEPWSFGAPCEAVCRLALERRYRLLPHLYTLFHGAHTTGQPVMTPLFFADPSNPSLREVETSFLLGPLLVAASTSKDSNPDPATVVLPAGIWQRFHFGDPHPDLPLLYLQGGCILPCGPVIQSVEEAAAQHPLTLLLALDESGCAEGLLYEDAGDGYGFEAQDYLLTTYCACVEGKEVVVRVGRSEGNRPRPHRPLWVRLLLGDAVEVEGRGVDGEEVRINLPSEEDGRRMRASSARFMDEMAQQMGVLDLPGGASEEEVEVKRVALHLTSPAWDVTVLPQVGGRIISMCHLASGREWLEGRMEQGGYEEYSGTEYRSPGCTEVYAITRQGEGAERVELEGDVGGGLALTREIQLTGGGQDRIAIRSAIVGKKIGAGSGGYSRIVCLRVHPSFRVQNIAEASVQFTSVGGERKELRAGGGEVFLKGQDRPNGEWRLVDDGSGWTLVNAFQLSQVDTCFVHWGEGDGWGNCNLELWSQERPVSMDTPLAINHEYRVVEGGVEK